MALVIERRETEGFWVGNIHVQIRSVRGKKVKVAVQAPANVKVLRDELTRFDEATQRRDDPPGE